MNRIYRDTAQVMAVDHTKDVEVKPEELAPNGDTNRKYSELFSFIYAPDPMTKLPTGDLQMFMSKDTNPEIRDFIQRNLMQPTSTPPTDVKLSDDDIKALSRAPGESRSSYAARVRSYLDSYKDSLSNQKTE